MRRNAFIEISVGLLVLAGLIALLILTLRVSNLTLAAARRKSETESLP